jgi:plasmid replication initiation protein
MKPNKKIYHDNDLKSELMEMELAPRRILWIVLAKLEKDGFDLVFDPDYIFTITAKEYSLLAGVSESVAYKQLKRGIEVIRSYLMRIPEKNVLSEKEMKGKNKDRMIVFTAANYGVYSDGDGYIELKLDPIMAPYISKLKSNFTGQFLLSALRLPDSNANKLYLLLCEWISSGMSLYKDIKVCELKKSLMVSHLKTYDLYNDFNNMFIKRSVKKILEITEFTTINMEIIERRGRKAHVVRISYEYNDQLKHLGDAGKVSGIKAKKKKEVVQKPEKERTKEDMGNNSNEDVLFFIGVGRFLDRSAANALKLNWNEGLTSKEALILNTKNK